jgi:predicted CXXCH cytochrome family protein
MHRPALIFGAVLLWTALLLTAAFLPRIEPGNAGESPVASHFNIDCASCHAQVADVTGDGLGMPSYDAKCRNCHTNLNQVDQTSALSFHQNPSRPCSNCHSFHNPEEIVAGKRPFLIRFEQKSRFNQCRACHGAGENLSALSEGHLVAAKLFHSDFRIVGHLTPSQACLACHSERSTTSAELSSAMAVTPRFADHASHPVGVQVVPGSGRDGNRIRMQLDSRLQLFGGRMECQTCHSLSSSLPNHLAGFKDRDDLCRGCHQLD